MNKLAVIFAGQGSQYEGMGSKLYDRYPEIRGIYDSLGKELTDISFKGSIEEISKTQPSAYYDCFPTCRFKANSHT